MRAARRRRTMDGMGTVTDYLDGLDQPARDVLAHVVAVAREVAPDAEEGLGYGMPALTYRGAALLSAMRTARHLAVYPFSAGVVEAVAPELDGVARTKGSIAFQPDAPLPDDVVRRLVTLRVAEIDARADRRR